MKLRFDIQGMTCSACSARVEKVSSGVPGVASAGVNLLKNTMDVTLEDGADASAVSAAICTAVTKAGYGAALQSDTTRAAAPATATDDSRHEAVKKAQRSERTRLIISVVFCVPLFYLAMGPMFGWPIPLSPTEPTQVMAYALVQFLLVIPIIAANFPRFSRGFRSLAGRAPNMDSLVCLGATASLVYGIFGLFRIGYLLGTGDACGAHMASEGLYFDSAGMILTLICVGKYLEARAKGNTTSAVSALIDLTPKTAIVMRDGAEVEIPAADVAKGDACVVRAGSAVPVDGHITQGAGSLDESAITGESVPADKSEGDMVTGGTLCTSGWFVMEAEHVGADTALAQIIALVDEATGSKAPIERVADKISGVFVPIVIGIAVLVFIIWLLMGGGFATALNHCISVLVISCPCALGLATPTAIMVGTGRGATHGILVKSAEMLERAGRMKSFVFDKTGTVTCGTPTVCDVLPNGDMSSDELLAFTAGLEARSEHPLARAICTYAEASLPSSMQRTLDTDALGNFDQIPGQGLRAEQDGALLLAGNTRMMDAQGVTLTHDDRRRLDELADAGKTPLCFARGDVCLGIITLMDAPKPTAAATMQALRKRGIDTVMLTGDNERTAAAIQALVGCDSVIAGVLPQEKEAKIRKLQEDGPVAMVGDGTNDAPALARADCGVAIGAGTDIALESADVVLVRSDPADAVALVDLSRATMRNIKQNLFWALFYNVICIPVAAGVLSGIGINLNPMIAAAAMGCSSLFVVCNALRLRSWKPEPIGIEAAGAAVAADEAEAAESASAEVANAATAAAGSVEAAAPTPSPADKTSTEVAQKTLDVEGMMCEHCVGRVTKALEAVDGVIGADVDLDAGSATVHLSKDVSDEALITAVTDADYEARMR